MKIIQFYDTNTKHIAELTKTNIELYCDTHNFDLLRIECETYYPEMKIEQALEHLEDDVWLLDLDVFIKDNRVNIYNLIDNKPIELCYASSEPKYKHQVNCGSVILRKGCEDFLNQWYTNILGQLKQNPESKSSDQGAFWQTWNQNEDYDDLINVHRYNLFNHNGAFLHHFCISNKYEVMVTENKKHQYDDRFAQIFRYLSDKHLKHNYGLMYTQLLGKINSVLEIGNLHGGGLTGFAQFFSTDDIEGVDVSPHKNKSKFHVHEGDSKTFECTRQYDLIVDDGDHRLNSQIETWKNLKAYADVAYVIEDINKNHIDKFKELGFEVMTTANRPDSNIAIQWT